MLIMENIASPRRNKHFVLDQSKLNRAKKILGAKTESETVEIALQRIINEAETNNEILSAQNRFVLSTTAGLEIEDVFGNLDE